MSTCSKVTHQATGHKIYPFSYLAKRTFITIWEVKFKLRILELLGVLHWTMQCGNCWSQSVSLFLPYLTHPGPPIIHTCVCPPDFMSKLFLPLLKIAHLGLTLGLRFLCNSVAPPGENEPGRNLV
jgi:hypothetical protein